MARFYQLSIEPTLFGDVSLTRNWGRIGRLGQQRVHLFSSEKEAVDLFLKLLAQKRSRGYRPNVRA
ncbi:putative DNA-binding WGR domain protein [Rhizobium mesoamericanum]|nr:putative DNA-binding WGR domain protein [Rhizobium mesoamericanum]